MTKEQIKQAIVEILFDLHSFNKLDARVLNSIGKNFDIDIYEMCEDNGITYNIE